jgi:hypothetical protein
LTGDYKVITTGFVKLEAHGKEGRFLPSSDARLQSVLDKTPSPELVLDCTTHQHVIINLKSDGENRILFCFQLRD